MYSVAKFCNYISLSKFNKNRLVIIDLKRLVLFYFIDNLHYKKNDILFFIFICLFSGGVFKINKSICGSFSFYSFALVSKNIGVFLRNFINLYLPLLFIDNKLKWISCGKQVENCTVFYSNCPMIPELDLLTILCPTIWDLVWSFRFQLIFYFGESIFGFSEFYLRFYRLPFNFSYCF